MSGANPWSSSVGVQTGTAYTIASTDAGLTLLFTNSSPVTVTLPSGGVPGFPTRIVQWGTGPVTIQAGAAATLVSAYATPMTLQQFSGVNVNVAFNSDGASAQWYIAAIPAYALPVATLTTLGGVKGNLSYFAKTASSINVTLGAISVLGVSVLPSVTVTVPGVTAGDFVLASFAGTAPTSITIGGVQATAANTVVITPIATAALVAGSQVVAMNFAFMH